MGRFKVQLPFITNVLPPSGYFLRDRLHQKLEFLLIIAFLRTTVSSNVIHVGVKAPILCGLYF